jgi:cytoskeleton protein RodZ
MTESIGETLREARHQRKASLEDVARATKIKTDILEKLEADDFNALAAPLYTKAFIKLYAEFLGLDSAAVVETYLKSQGGLRRQGLHVETEAAIRARKPRELQLSMAAVLRVVAVLTALVVVVTVTRYFWMRRAPVAAAKPAALPAADFEAVYHPKNKPGPALLDPSGK